MTLPFVKMHGIGNDYVYVNGFAHDVVDPGGLARVIADRHFGVGGVLAQGSQEQLRHPGDHGGRGYRPPPVADAVTAYRAAMTTTSPYGSWASIVSAADVVSGGSLPTAVHAADGIVWWSESRPAEDGREAIVRRDADATVHEVLPRSMNARTAVHEYGGGAWWVHDETVFATSWDDQRLYRIDPTHQPLPITPEPPEPRAWRYADGRVTPDGRWVVCIRERHEGPDVSSDVHNELVAIRTDGTGVPVVLFADSDFVAAPRISRDGRQLAWPFSWTASERPFCRSSASAIAASSRWVNSLKQFFMSGSMRAAPRAPIAIHQAHSVGRTPGAGDIGLHRHFGFLPAIDDAIDPVPGAFHLFAVHEQGRVAAQGFHQQALVGIRVP